MHTMTYKCSRCDVQFSKRCALRHHERHDHDNAEKFSTLTDIGMKER